MNTNDYELLDVKKTSSQVDPSAIDVIITIRRNSDQKVITSTVTPSLGYYDELMSAIDDFKSGEISMGSFVEIALQASLAESEEALVGMTQNDKTLSSHIKLRNGHVYVDNKLINKVLERHVLDIMRESNSTDNSNDKWVSLIHFVEKLYSNQSSYVRNQFYGWLDYQSQHGKITLTKDGNLVAYKGVKIEPDYDGTQHAYSIHAGHGFVNGVEYKDDFLPNDVGSIIEIPREEVNSDPNEGCHVGLHVGTWDYATSFGNGNTLTVEVDPADIVSVPNDSEYQKIRVSKYKVLEVVVKPIDETIFSKTTKTSNTSVPELFSTIEYVTSHDDKKLLFTREHVNIDFDKEDEDYIYLYDLDTDHYYSLQKGNIVFKGYNNQEIPQGSFHPRSYYSNPVFEHDETKLVTFSVPKEYATLHYVSEHGNEHDFAFDDIVIEDADYVNLTIFDKNQDHYFTLHKTNITFFDDNGNEIGNASQQDGSKSDDAHEPIQLKFPDKFTFVLYVTKSGEPRQYRSYEIDDIVVDNKNLTYNIKFVNGDYRSLDAERVAFVEPNDTVDVDMTTEPMFISDDVRSLYGINSNTIVFAVFDANRNMMTLITDEGQIVDIEFSDYVHDFM